MQAMIEVPDDPVAKLQAQLLEYPIVVGVEREDFAVLHVIADFPTQTAIGRENPDQSANDWLLFFQVGLYRLPAFIFLAEIVRRRCNNQVDGAVRNTANEFASVSAVQHHLSRWGEAIGNLGHFPRLQRQRHVKSTPREWFRSANAADC